MKKYLIVIYTLLISMTLLAEYNYPFKDPNMATIIGSSTLMTEGIPEKIDIKEYKIKLPWSKPVMENFWYNEGFKYSVVSQNRKAPLIFLLAGTGSSHNSVRMEYFQRIFYKAGYHVVSISSPMNSNFVINASTNQMPGIIIEDSEDIYHVMEAINEKITSELEISDYYLVGYSLGGTEAGILSWIDEREKKFNFKRVFMINPAVNLYKSALKLDRYMNYAENERAEKVAQLINNILNTAISSIIPEYTTFDMETIFKVFSQKKLSDKEMQQLIGGAFRLTSIDLNYITDVVNDRKVYIKEPVNKFSPMFKYFEEINFATFEEYINKLAFPYYKEKLGEQLTLDELLKKANLSYIEDYLKNSSKVMAVTNADELILDSEDLEFLKMTFGKRLIIYPYGGHCGNMFFTPNIKVMLEFLEKGEIEYENK